jgi:hypothetical protein
MDNRGMGFVEAMAVYRREVLRWNTQINLVSRRDTQEQLDALIEQCDSALSALAAEAPELQAERMLYCDLGSGGGLPGVVWHRRLAERSPALQAWLVEPREKRAWFLQRTARFLGDPPFEVACARWNEVVGPVETAADTCLVSLKALRLTDSEVLAGLETLCGARETFPARVVVARFHPGGEVLTPVLADELGIVGAGRQIGPWRAAGAAGVPGPEGAYPPAALVVSRHVLT